MTREDAKRKPLAEVSEDEFLEDLIAFLQANGGEKLAPPGCDANTFPTRTLNGAKLDLFGLYRAVVSRGGFPSSKGGVNGGGGGDKREKLNWTRDVFPCLSNYTENHRATSVGHDLITHYQNYLCEYELANPEDVVTSAADPTSLSFRTDPRPPAVSVSAEGGGRGRGRPRGSGRGRGRGRGRGGRGRSAGASAGASRAAGRAGKIRVPTYAPSDFAVGCTVRVFWKQDRAWYTGVIEDQQSSAPEGAEEGAEEGAAAAAAVVLSKVVYDDGDVEILDLVGGAEKVVLVARADGAPTGDGDRDYLSDSDDDDDGAAAAGGAPLSRRASARAGNDAGLPLSRRAEAKEAAAREARRARLGGGGDADDDDDDGDGGGGGPRRAPGAPGPSLAAVRARDDADAIRAGLRRNPARAAAVAAFGGDDDDLPPPSDERVGAVLEAMKSNDVARVLSELPFAHEESSEVYKLGYAMGARRAIAVCAAVVAAAAARAGAGAGEAAADAATAKKRKLSGGRAGGGDESGGAGAGAGASPPPSGGGRVRKKSARAAAWEEDKEKAAAKAKAAAGEEKKTDGSPGGDEEAEVKDEAAKKRADDVAEADVKLGAALASRAKRPHGAWEDALSAAARDPALTAVLARVERVLEKETFDPDVGDSDDDDADADGWTRGIDAGAVADKTREGINANVVRGVLGVTAAFETARGWRGSAAAIAASKAIFAPPAPAPAPGAAVGAPPSASRPSPNTPKNTPNDPPPNPKPPSRASALDPAALAAKAANAPPAAKAAAAASMGAKIEPPPTGVVSAAGGEHVAAAYEEAAAKRLAAEAELARIADPVKLAFVQDDATKPKPTTTAGRLIKAANNAKARAERVAAGGGTFRSRGASGGQYGGGGGGAGRGPGRPPSAAAAAVAKRVKPTDPAKAAFMEQTGPSGLGAKAFEFRPPLAPTATAAAAEAFERAAAAGGGGDDADAMDCALSLDGDDGVTRWLTRRGWGEYAAGFASYGVTMETLPGLSMQDMENMPAFMSPEMRAKVHAAAVAVGTKRGGAGAGTAGAKSPPKRKATATATATAAKSAAEKDGAKVASPSRSRKSPSASPAKRQRGSESRSIHSGLSG